jgi:hypothetical protein
MIYIVTSGSYSDYSIEAVFTTEELAKAYIETLEDDCYGDYSIEEYVENPPPKEVFPCTIVRGSSLSSNVEKIEYRYYNTYTAKIYAGTEFISDKPYLEVCIPRECTETEACKIFSEKRAQLMALHPERAETDYAGTYNYTTLCRE